MNIAVILRNAPKGTKLYSPIFGEVTLLGTNCSYIEVSDSINIIREFCHDGRFYVHGECMLFPSRDNRDWNNFFICPFKKGDFIVKECPNSSKHIAIFSRFGGPYEYTTHYLCLLRADGTFKPEPDFGIGKVQEARLATDSEKKEFLQSFVERVDVFPEEQPGGRFLKRIKFRFPVYFDGAEVENMRWDNETTVESVVTLVQNG